MKKLFITLSTTIFILFSSSAFSFTKVKLTELDNFKPEQSLRFELIALSVEKIINTERFKQAILSYNYNKTGSFADNKKLSNAEIYKIIMEGKEKLSSSTLNEWNFHLRTRVKFAFWSSVTAFTSDNTPFITFYTSYISKARDAEIAATLCHEQMHKLGFGHDSKATAKRPFSVPYAVGSICENLYINHLSEVKLDIMKLHTFLFPYTLLRGETYAAFNW